MYGNIEPRINDNKFLAHFDIGRASFNKKATSTVRALQYKHSYSGCQGINSEVKFVVNFRGLSRIIKQA